jgi:hypothetical protein
MAKNGSLARVDARITRYPMRGYYIGRVPGEGNQIRSCVGNDWFIADGCTRKVAAEERTGMSILH